MFSKTHLKIFGLVAVLCAVVVTSVVADRPSDLNRKFKVKKGGQLIVEIDNVAADIEIRVSRTDEVQVDVSGVSDDDLEDLEITQSGNTIQVEYYGGRKGWRRSRHAHFLVRVPREFDLDLATSGGDIEVDDEIKGRVEASTSGGDIQVENVEGELYLRTSGGDVTAKNVIGDAELKTSGGEIEIGDVEGQLEAHTSGGDIRTGSVKKDLDARTAGGDIEVGDVGGYADVSTAGGDITLGKVSGEANVRTAGGDIELKSATGRITAQTAGGDIDLENITGSVNAETAGGDIRAELIPGKDRGSSFDTAGGDIELYVPENSKTTIEAEVRLRGWGADEDEWGRGRDYDIFSDFKPTEKEKDSRGIHAKFVLNGGGKTISLETTNGDIHVMKLK